jgi:SAM-dependent methyltransferase
VDQGLPANHFNNKVFQFISCPNCGLLFIDPIPDEKDLREMYPVSYQQGVSREKRDPGQKPPGLRYPYQAFYDIIKNKGVSAKVVDFGCGNGQFVYNALQEGITVHGVEFSPEQVQLMKEELKETAFYTIEEFYKDEEKYDVIVLSNVLEHFTDPKAELSRLIGKLNINGLLVAEGPLEHNSSFVNFCKWEYFRLRKLMSEKYTTFFPPVHIFYSNYRNQLAFFESFGLKTNRYECAENEWPFPARRSNARSLGDVIKYLLAKLSKLFKFFLPKYGNTFIYVGEKK